MRISFRDSFDTASRERKRSSSVSGAEIFELQRNKRHHVRILATFCGTSWALGLLVFSIAEWIHADPTFEHVHAKAFGHRVAHMNIVLVSTAGAITFLTGVSGYWGSLHLEHGMVFAFSYIIFAASIIELSIGAIMLSIPKELIEEITMEYVKNGTDNYKLMFEIQALACSPIVTETPNDSINVNTEHLKVILEHIELETSQAS
ncbi:uncharacterized protein NPIL_548271 [Nephila pilipes]|uniref:Uncharacterized protein n=1 Tax=Nephila pilipes TaxID=299642 RepID=A0A8X6PT88_NEPPI|nr:uncharacterized protein NPIL_548271 [Nephila pilipes]